MSWQEGQKSIKHHTNEVCHGDEDSFADAFWRLLTVIMLCSFSGTSRPYQIHWVGLRVAQVLAAYDHVSEIVYVIHVHILMTWNQYSYSFLSFKDMIHLIPLK